MRITISRDGGKTWDRAASRVAWIPHGTEHDSYDRLVIGAVPPLRVGDEDWFYVTVIDGDHLGIRANAGQTPYYRHRLPKGQVALYTQKHNRYVSLTAGNTPEVLITRDVQCEGGALQLNADASRGSIRLAVAPAGPVMGYDETVSLDAPHVRALKPLDGFGFYDCVPVLADGIEQTVQFRNAEVASLKGKAICLLFEMVDADLYACRIV
jgi:hypothetical protein